MRVRSFLPVVAILAVALSAVSTMQAQAPDSSSTIQPIPRAERPVMMIAPFEFTATPSQEEV